MRSLQKPLEFSRLSDLYTQAVRNTNTDQVYAFLKNLLNFFGYRGFEVELYALIEGLKR